MAMKHSLGIPLVLACFLVAQNRSPGQSATPHQEPAYSVPTNIHQLFLDDQVERTGRGARPNYGPDVNSRDAMRRAEAKSLLGAGELKTAQDFHDAAFIFQHGHDPDDYLLAHILAIDAIVKGDSSSKWLAAATLDRYLQAIGQKQVFGAQYLSKSYSYSLQHKNDPSALKSPEAREEGDTQDPYDRDLVPAGVRGDFCVPDQAVQASNLNEINAGKPMTGQLPPGCDN
jgi:hypothetical protein